MPEDPCGEKRPADANGLAAMTGKMATGQIGDEREDLSSAASAWERG